MAEFYDCTLRKFACFVLISFVMVRKASSTFKVYFALVSMKGMPNYSANSLPSAVETCLCTSISHLLPTRILQTPWTEYFSISWIHVLTFSKVSLSVTSYTIIIPYAPIHTHNTHTLSDMKFQVSNTIDVMHLPL